ncbi:mannose-6-phosphate isomerase, class I [Glycomyces algeriensis]|uniref:mannose-6-phosphate isomerase n=1 Tax=Glycomyces algeriensis TaxID=256037 RepID=A0A9W6LF82_9ACTN|nr:mannose-6-phosphate isomerase, class I [Glycomyces algeriensis]MDA1366917.1 mannose-6-phosphate isomerase, class I [Glycomyces algeriensis]MDR7352697.1 mannose-6-phosphate isomerase [Glycomyces algeriensis]GLI40379.1 mannose-6-phosphate isomerase, class I [Glycomyces algeriensis]
MLIPIDNDPRPYAWGAVGRIAALLDRPATGGPEAELWLGAHAGSPARLLDPAAAGGAADLRQWIAQDPESALGPHFAAGERLPFLLKVLAAGSPLSLQAHPNPEQAAEGFARENAAGLALDAADRNYRDPFHKPELIVAVSETFDALCGFRPVAEARSILDAIIALDDSAPLRAFAKHLEDGYSATVAWLLGGDAAPAVARLVHLAAQAEGLPDDAAAALATVRELAAAYPGDPGAAVSLLLNRVRLRRGEALYLPAGNLHAYLDGVGIELMAASDNVLRGGLTGKHIDVPELLHVLDCEPLPVPRLDPEHPAPGVRRFRPDVPDFALYQLDLDTASASIRLDGPAVAIATTGRGRIAGTDFAPGTAWYLTPEESPVAITGTGEVFLATVNEAPSQHHPTPEHQEDQR